MDDKDDILCTKFSLSIDRVDSVMIDFGLCHPFGFLMRMRDG